MTFDHIFQIETRGTISLGAFFFNTVKKHEGPRALDRSPESWHIRWCIDWPVAKEISFKDISIFSSSGHVVQLS